MKRLAYILPLLLSGCVSPGLDHISGDGWLYLVGGVLLFLAVLIVPHLHATWCDRRDNEEYEQLLDVFDDGTNAKGKGR